MVLGIVALAVAMGIGRFAFTPLLPLMLRDGDLNAATGAEWAAANYIGYLVGALTAARFAPRPRQGLRWALLGVVVTTMAVAGLSGPPWVKYGGVALRFASGIFSAWALVCASSWCLAELARRGAAPLGAWVFMGVGVGISGAGAFTWLGGWQSAAWLWLELGLLSALGAWFVWQRLRGSSGDRFAERSLTSSAPPAARPPPPPLSPAPLRPHLPWVLCYGSFGFGYIVPATFLPAMARQQVADPFLFGLTWPLFGVAAALSVAAAARWLGAWPRQRVWALAQGTMAMGTALPLFTQALWSLAASALLVGGTFMVATMAGMQWARERLPANPTPLLARMTVAFATGQIVGPVLVRALGDTRAMGWDAIAWANAAATAVLALTAAWLAFARPPRGHPNSTSSPRRSTP